MTSTLQLKKNVKIESSELLMVNWEHDYVFAALCVNFLVMLIFCSERISYFLNCNKLL